MKLRDLSRFNTGSVLLDSNTVKVTVTELSEMKKTDNNKAEQSILRQVEAIGIDIDPIKAEEIALSSALATLEKLSSIPNVRLQITNNKPFGDKFVTTIALGEFEKVPAGCNGFGGSPIKARTERLAIGADLQEAYENALARSLKDFNL